MTRTAPQTLAPPRAGRRRLSIEASLRWAFAEELANAMKKTDGGDAVGLPSMHPMWRGSRIDGGRAGWDDAAVARIIAPDALEIGAAVARLRCADLEPPDLLEDEERTHFVAWRGRAEALVVMAARLGRAPDTDDIPVPGPVRSRNGAPLVRRLAVMQEQTVSGEEIAVERERAVSEGVTLAVRGKPTRGRYPSGSYCPLEWFPPFESVARDRAEYQVWRAALDRLAAELVDLDRVEVLPSAAPWRPWLAN